MIKQGINTYISRLLIPILFFGFLLTSCEKQEEQMENRDQVVGQWDVVENVADPQNASANIRAINLAYIVNITRSQVFADEVYIYNFFDIGYDFYVPAAIDGQRITIDEIELRDHTISGSGEISNDNHTIEWTYWVEQPHTDRKQYNATYTFRQ